MTSVNREVRYHPERILAFTVLGVCMIIRRLFTQIIGNYTAAFREGIVSRVRNPALASGLLLEAWKPGLHRLELSCSSGSLSAEEMKGGMRGMGGVPYPPACSWVGLLYKPVGFSFMHPGY